ncbi:MAG: SAM-dependent methyltransferase [Ginsengibacter sp.]
MVYLVPSFLSPDAIDTIPASVLPAINNSQVIFAENERTARRFLKSLSKEIVIDKFEWFTIHKAEQAQVETFRKKIKENKNIAIISEAGCPGIADPGQILVREAQKLKVVVKPLTGPSSIILALMASGLNGQKFCFNGYLPIDNVERNKKIKQLEEESIKSETTQVFIETPFRNNKMLEALLKNCRPSTHLCIAVDITSSNESIQTRTVMEWRIDQPDLNKRPTIFLFLG